MVAAIFDVIIRPDFGSFGLGIQVTLYFFGEGERRLIEFVEQRFTTCTILFHLTLV